jgi:hypothetical protein
MVSIPNLTGVFGDIGNLASSVSAQDILTSILAGTAGTVVISGLKSPDGLNAVDPLHLIHKPAQPATDTKPATPATTAVVSGPGVMLMSKFMALTPDQQKLIEAMNYSILPG